MRVIASYEKSSRYNLQNQQGDTISEKYALSVAKEHDLSIIVRVDNAMSILSENESIVLDTKRALVYKSS